MMMKFVRSLFVKLTLAFLIVGLTGALLVAVIIRQSTQTAFNQFVLDRDVQALAANLEQYYQYQGSWAGVRQILQSGPPAPGFNNGHRGFPRNMTRFTLVGLDRSILFSNQLFETRQTYSSSDLSQAIPLTVNGATIGWLVPDTSQVDMLLTTPEGIFLQRVNQAALLSALVAAGLALLLGGLLAYTFTRSIHELTEATHEIARGNLGLQVKIHSRDELGNLAASFNKMSQDLEQATQARRQMTADIAHDLRSPISVISGYAEALSEGKLPGTPDVYDTLYRETKQLGRLVEDLRLLSLADAGELPLNLQPVQPPGLLEQAASRLTVAVQAKSIQLSKQAEPGLPMVQVDPERMIQVFDNLILNAIRYSPESGVIEISASLTGNRVCFQVRDSGSGISPEDLPYIFDRFYKGDKSRHQDGESGLGLAIVKSIVEAHHGKICVESQSGSGSTFSILLPVSV
jgi:signal transduction histidine kinase